MDYRSLAALGQIIPASSSGSLSELGRGPFNDTATAAEWQRLQEQKLNNRNATGIRTINPGLPPDMNTMMPEDLMQYLMMNRRFGSESL